MNIRNDFPMLTKDIIYFDNAATTYKLKEVINAVVDYYENYSANAHRGDYDISLKVDTVYEGVRDKVKIFINADNTKEIIFTSGTTMSLNMIVFGFFKDYLNKDDEVLITKSEHASNVLPWYELSKEKGIKINYIKLNKELEVTLDSVKSSITPKTKVISIAHITNVIGDVRPLKEIIEYAHKNNILVVVDGAQSISHMKIDVKDLDVDFFVFSGHKMYGPTGIGVLYGKYDLLDKLKPIFYGGGMNTSFTSNQETSYKELPLRLEAGTQNIEGVIGLGASIDYLNKIGLDNIYNYELGLKRYAVDKLKLLPNIIVYNENTDSNIVVFNVKNIFAEDTSRYLNKYNICIRSGSHCAKILSDELGIKNTCRMSLCLYNTKEEIDRLIEVLDKDIIKEIL
ncbi:MAG: cysteine desulfurase [Bacilli bacterium]